MRYHVAVYELYPIYEPAEGGYFYAGSELYGYESTNSLRKAKKWLTEACEMFNCSKVGWHGYSDEKYIGEGYEVHIETKLGKHTSGKVTYC